MLRLIRLEKEADFDSLISNSEKLLVKFSIPNCVPCKEIDLSLDKLSRESIFDDLLIVEVNARRFPGISSRTCFSVFSVPTIFFVEKGKIMRSHNGSMKLEELKGFLLDRNNKK
jgi:thioredoxin-like negative regulator of GroEL